MNESLWNGWYDKIYIYVCLFINKKIWFDMAKGTFVL